MKMEKKQQGSKRSESSESQEYKPNSSNAIEQVHQVEDTPFTVIRAQNAYHICLANQIVANQPFTSIEEALKYIKQKPWQLILTSAYLYGKMVEAKLQEQKEKPAQS